MASSRFKPGDRVYWAQRHAYKGVVVGPTTDQHDHWVIVRWDHDTDRPILNRPHDLRHSTAPPGAGADAEKVTLVQFSGP